MIQVSSEIRHRGDLGRLANQHHVRDAIEIGTDRGAFAVEFLEKWKGYTLVCIDPYAPYPNMPWDRTMDRLVAVHRLAPFGDRVRFLPWKSPEAATRMHADWRFQFCYIDGAHDYESVKADVEAWYGRVDDGGILAGHDFVAGGGVERAVLEFSAPRGLHVYVTQDAPASWYLFKR